MKADRTISYGHESEIESLLIGRKVIKVDGDSLILDNGTRLMIVPNEGCSGCASGNYWVEHITSVNNAITNVEFETEYDEEDSDYIHYKVFVIADGMTTELFDVYGTDGNGYYGTGYEIKVYLPDK